MAIDKAWEQIHSTTEWGAYPSEHVIRFVARNYYKVTNRKDVRILDYGAGGGAHTWYLAREGFDTYAFDGAPSAAEKIKKRLEKEQLQADVRCFDGVNNNYKNDFFDAVIDNFCICSNKINDIESMYRGIHNILKDDGRFLTCVFGKNTTGYGEGTQIEEDTFTDIKTGNLSGLGVSHFFDMDSLKEELEDAGFKDIYVEKSLYTDRGSTLELLIAMSKK